MATLDQQLTFVLENLQLPADQITAKKQHILQELELTSLKGQRWSTQVKLDESTVISIEAIGKIK